MSADDELAPRLGRIRDRGVSRLPTALSEIKTATQRAGGRPGAAGRSASPRPSTFGRGRSAAIAAGRDAARRAVVVKARVVRRARGRASLADHLKYLARDGTDRDGSPGRLFDAAGETVNRKAFADRAADDRHHFRFIVSGRRRPDDGPAGLHPHARQNDGERPRNAARLGRRRSLEHAYVVSRRERKKVEMLFAHLKRILKLDRLRLRGPNGAKDEFLLAATAQNLRKMAKLIPPPTPVIA
jgi:hypothetical protein